MHPDRRRRPATRRSRTTGRRGLDLAGLCAGVVLMTAACGDPLPPEPGLTGGWSTAGCEFAREPQSIEMGETAMLVTPPDLEAAMARIDEAGRKEYVDSYAGLEVDQREVRAIVYRVASAAFDSFIRQTAENTCITVHDAEHTLTDLTAWQARVVADLPEWSAAGVKIFTIGARHDGAGVELGVEDALKAKDQLLARYGQSAPLLFQQQAPVGLLPSPASPQVTPTRPPTTD